MLIAVVLGLLFLLLMLMNVPIAIALGFSSILVIFGFHLMPLSSIPILFLGSLESFPLLAIPFFMFAGLVMEKGNISEKLINFANNLIGEVCGGLAYVVIVVSVFMAGISGSGPADVAALGSVLIPSMEKSGYKKEFSAGLISVTGAIGIIFPPSIALIIYGVVSNTSIIKLFLAGVVPGILIGIALIIPTYIISKKRGYTGKKRASKEEFIKSFKDAIWGLLAPVIVLFGLYSGIFTTTEISAILAVYVLFVSKFIYKDINFKKLSSILSEAAELSATVLLIIACANLFSWILTTQGVAMTIGRIILNISGSQRIIFLSIVSFILLIAGCFLETNAIIYMFTPIFLPLVNYFGIDTVYFGILMVVCLAIGEATPPLGVNLFIASGISGIEVEKIAKEAMPFILSEIIVLFVFIFFPGIITFFPGLLY